MAQRFRKPGPLAGPFYACVAIGLTLATSWVPEVAAAEAPARSRVVIVRGTASVPAAEREFAARLPDRFERLLAEYDIPARTINDEDVGPVGLQRAKVAILPYNPNLPAKELEALRVFVSGGGRLIVFYSSDPGLAELMGMKLGKYLDSSIGREWHSFSFSGEAPAGMPKRIYQTSRVIRPVYPTPGRSSVIAYWEDESGQELDDPAWVRSEHGFWMTHILLDGDQCAKRTMLAALLGTVDPAIWKTVADKALVSAGDIGPLRGYEASVFGISEQAENAGREKQVSGWLAQAATLRGEMNAAYSEARYVDAASRAAALNETLSRAYGAAQLRMRDEFVGVWDHTGLGLYPGDWERTCSILADSGVTAVFPNVMTAGVAHFKSKVLPHSELVERYGDQLLLATHAASKYGLEVHAWKLCWRVDGAPPEVITSLQKDDRLQMTRTGEVLNWLCPSDPRNLQLELDAVRDAVERYGIDGIHLDYNRYRDSSTCYCQGCKARFMKDTGRRIRDWPQDAFSGRHKKAYSQWRCAQTRKLVEGVKQIARSSGRECRVSAAVFGGYPKCVPSVAQDWVEWLREGHVDFVCPMNYVSNIEKFSELVRMQVNLPGARGHVFPGLGVTADESRLTAAQTVEQVLVARELGAGGWLLFALNPVLHRETLPVLNLGLTSKPGQPDPGD